jgi:hypothetical protein
LVDRVFPPERYLFVVPSAAHQLSSNCFPGKDGKANLSRLSAAASSIIAGSRSGMLAEDYPGVFNGTFIVFDATSHVHGIQQKTMQCAYDELAINIRNTVYEE